ncbi:MAG: AraC family transcriptional regulator [Nostoc sp. DedQUE04]|uniref:helix-turn-helix transcriptional regulator n=1 Tax=Nostoc sp. DedQUE04 TaxID=3075390 RepID=UPI002AD33FAB|nr:AraC family transcriptional regulator [Nostoc sp. DedQUE04]MDZ8136593.1 AraC family transcriptional regulator [Nostoc sp. DedQUE04]
MTITLTQKENRELWAEANYNSSQQAEAEPFEILSELPTRLGKGYVRHIEVHPHLWLSILDYEYHNDFLYKIPEWDHPLQFCILLSGRIVDEYGGQLGEGYTCISGSGVQRQITLELSKTRYVGVDIHLSADLLATFFPDEAGDIPHQLHFLRKGNDSQTLLYPETTTAIQGIAQQIINCPFQRITKQMYLQTKVLELMTLQLAPILSAEDGLQPSPRLKPETIARIHLAREILLARLENPPSLLELAQIVGISDRTLQRGFQELFGTTAFSYLTNKRMEWAEQLLRQGNMTIAEVGNKIGYSHLGHFASAFKRRFGITPSQSLIGKKSFSG